MGEMNKTEVSTEQGIITADDLIGCEVVLSGTVYTTMESWSTLQREKKFMGKAVIKSYPQIYLKGENRDYAIKKFLELLEKTEEESDEYFLRIICKGRELKRNISRKLYNEIIKEIHDKPRKTAQKEKSSSL